MSIDTEFNQRFDLDLPYEISVAEQCVELIYQLSPEDAQALRKISADYTIATIQIPDERKLIVSQNLLNHLPVAEDSKPCDVFSRVDEPSDSAVLRVDGMDVSAAMLEHLWKYVDMPDSDLPSPEVLYPADSAVMTTSYDTGIETESSDIEQFDSAKDEIRHIARAVSELGRHTLKKIMNSSYWTSKENTAS